MTFADGSMVADGSPKIIKNHQTSARSWKVLLEYCENLEGEERMVHGKKHGFLQHCNMPAEFVGQLLELVIGSAQEVAEQEKKGRAPNSGTGRSATTRCQMFTKDTKDITSARVF
jgi:hypothetical protein